MIIFEYLLKLSIYFFNKSNMLGQKYSSVDKVTFTKSDSLSLSAESHIVRTENQTLKLPSDLHMQRWQVSTHIHIHKT